MGGYDLAQKYGRNNYRQAMNAAIRAEIPGGDDFMNALTRVYLLSKSRACNEGEKAKFGEILRELQAAHEKMKFAIAEKYGLKYAEGEK